MRTSRYKVRRRFLCSNSTRLDKHQIRSNSSSEIESRMGPGRLHPQLGGASFYDGAASAVAEICVAGTGLLEFMRLLLHSFACIKSACNLSTAVLTTSCALVPNTLVTSDQLIRIGCNRSAEVRNLFKGRINGADFGPQGIRDIGVGATTSSNLQWSTDSFRGLVVDGIPHGDAFDSIST